MLNRALDDMDAIMPVGPTGERVPLAALATAMQRTSVLNNITVTNSNVGVLNTGDLAQIDAFISMTVGSDASAVGEQLRTLVQATLDSHALDADAKRETVELLQSLSQQLAGDRKKSVIMSLLRSIEERAEGANTIVQLVQAFGVGITKAFGF